MTVQALIDRLRTLPPEAEVRYDGIQKREDVTLVHTRIDADSHEPFVFLE